MFSFTNLAADSAHLLIFLKCLTKAQQEQKLKSSSKNKFVSDSKKFRNLEKKLLEEERES